MGIQQVITQIESVDYPHARTMQTRLAARVCMEDTLHRVTTVAGLDVGFDTGACMAIGGVVVLALPDFTVVDQQLARRKIVFRYQPGYLSFREVPVLLEAISRLSARPDLLICDGQGIAHPRRFGLACHLGVVLDIPAIGAAKSRLVGEYTDPGITKGSETALIDRGERVGTVLRTRDNTRPLFVSPGHKISLGSASEWVLRCCPRYRLPETTRHAHKLVSG